MISKETQAQLDRLQVKSGRPMVISDVDDVLVHFLRAFETYIDRHGLWLDPATLALTGNIKHKQGTHALNQREVERLIADFFTDMTAHMDPMEDAVDHLMEISGHANVVLLTNAPHEVADDRRTNLLRHGLNFPVITNSGAKGPAIAALSNYSDGTTVFIDDNPGFLKSAFDWVPDIKLVHFMHDERFRRHVKEMDFVHLHTASWREAGPFILGTVKNGRQPL